jgi:hypothetical protein
MDTKELQRYTVMVCLDGSYEAYEGLRWAANLVRDHEADIILLHVRKEASNTNLGGINSKVVLENLAGSGIEIPGMECLNAGREILLELGDLSDDWTQKENMSEVSGDPLGDYFIQYSNPAGGRIGKVTKLQQNLPSGI